MKEFIEIKTKANNIIKQGWIKSVSRGFGNAGITFEYLLGKNRENFEIPDYEGIEIKTKSYGTENYITLFSATPDSYLYETKRLRNDYGYPDKDYPEYKVFNNSFFVNKKTKIRNNITAQLRIDYENKKIILQFFNTENKIIDQYSSWSFDLLEEKLTRKFKKLFIIRYRKRKIDNIDYFKYQNYTCYKLKTFNDFINAIDNGYIRITFKVGIYKSGKKFGKTYDHGTTFDIHKDNLKKIFYIQ